MGDTGRNSDAQKKSAKDDGRNHNRGKDRKNMGRNFSERPSSSTYPSKEGKESSGRNENSDKKDVAEPNNSTQNTSSANDSAHTSTDPPKEKERSGKSYRSK